jgi:copper(I)-binding protein
MPFRLSALVLVLLSLMLGSAFAGGYSSSSYGLDPAEMPPPEITQEGAVREGGQASQQEQPVLPPRDATPPGILSRAAEAARKPHIQSAWARAAKEGGSTAVFLTLVAGKEPDRLVGLETGWADTAEIHKTTVGSDGVARMTRHSAISLPVGTMARFVPGGLHVMLGKLHRDLRPGQVFILTLHFEKAGDIPVRVAVRSGN